jgi:hypothetical protein
MNIERLIRLSSASPRDRILEPRDKTGVGLERLVDSR